ncbi:MAG: hypothetical protein FWC79_06680 [Oscillospiraceae bacterium]|nr:hypothetical protein [Oscillospiraceae bacterium]
MNLKTANLRLRTVLQKIEELENTLNIMLGGQSAELSKKQIEDVVNPINTLISSVPMDDVLLLNDAVGLYDEAIRMMKDVIKKKHYKDGQSMQPYEVKSFKAALEALEKGKAAGIGFDAKVFAAMQQDLFSGDLDRGLHDYEADSAQQRADVVKQELDEARLPIVKVQMGLESHFEKVRKNEGTLAILKKADEDIKDMEEEIAKYEQELSDNPQYGPEDKERLEGAIKECKNGIEISRAAQINAILKSDKKKYKEDPKTAALYKPTDDEKKETTSEKYVARLRKEFEQDRADGLSGLKKAVKSLYDNDIRTFDPKIQKITGKKLRAYLGKTGDQELSDQEAIELEGKLENETQMLNLRLADKRKERADLQAKVRYHHTARDEVKAYEAPTKSSEPEDSHKSNLPTKGGKKRGFFGRMYDAYQRGREGRKKKKEDAKAKKSGKGEKSTNDVSQDALNEILQASQQGVRDAYKVPGLSQGDALQLAKSAAAANYYKQQREAQSKKEGSDKGR